MNFDDLNDEIVADDWLIPREELTRRRVIRQTAHYTIYKADWFGDVLIYEPTGNKPDFKSTKQDLVTRRQTKCDQAEQETFRDKLNELCLNLSITKISQRDVKTQQGYTVAQDQADSAYSSISSTPQFYNKKHEFQFPELQHEEQAPEILGTKQALLSPENNCFHLELDDETPKQIASSTPRSPSVILNRNSFNFGTDLSNIDDIDGMQKSTGATCANWLELNELRLIAHENFMLFMGASIDDSSLHDDCSNQKTSLVMEMIKPKSVSLFNLLHASKSRLVSPHNRFFASNCRQLLSIADKLNICQQVTNAMTYLHAKNIVHGRLTSVNIYIETNQRVKISLIDNDEQPIVSCKSKPGSRSQEQMVFNLPTLTYLSPELVKTIKVKKEVAAATASGFGRLTQRGQHISGDIEAQIDLSLLTKQADIYSFGTLLFELFEERLPFTPDDYNTEGQTNSPKRSPSPTVNTTKLFDTLCLAYHHSPANRSSLFSAHLLQAQLTPLSTTLDKQWNSNIKSSASELIFQIGSGQISSRNRHRNKCPALVDQIISACWLAEPSCRPDFKQMKFD